MNRLLCPGSRSILLASLGLLAAGPAVSQVLTRAPFELPPFEQLARMSLFTLNTGARDDVVCSLRWEWEIEVPELGISVFEVPAVNVKGRKRSRLLVCNSVAQSVLESVRGEHDEFVFVCQRLKKRAAAPARASLTRSRR